jgi:hypothetical protein
MFEEVPSGTAAAQHLLSAVISVLTGFRKALEGQGEQSASPVPGVRGADRICWEEVQVGSEVDVVVAEVALGELHLDVWSRVSHERGRRLLLRGSWNWVRCCGERGWG